MQLHFKTFGRRNQQFILDFAVALHIVPTDIYIRESSA